MTMTRTLLYSTIALASLAITACGKEDKSSGAPAGSLEKVAPAADATRVETSVLAKTEAQTSFIRPGEIKGAREATLAAALGGFVEAVSVQSGQDVKKNQLIARIDSSTHWAQFRLADVEFKDAKREVERLEKMGNAIAGTRMDNARTRLERARAQKSLAATQSARANIRAPFAGTLVDLDLEPGEVVAPGAPIGRLIRLEKVIVSVSVTDRDVGLLSEGANARVLTSGAPNGRAGTITKIERAANLTTRTFLVEVTIDNPELKVLPGMIASVAFDASGAANKTILPQEFIVTRRQGNGVYVVTKDSKVEWRKLDLGDVVGSQVIVKSGLNLGEEFVTKGHRAIDHGDAVIVSRKTKCCRSGRVYTAAEKTADQPSSKKAESPAAVKTAPAGQPKRASAK